MLRLPAKCRMIRVFIVRTHWLHDDGTCRIAKFFVSGTYDGIELKATLSHFAQYAHIDVFSSASHFERVLAYSSADSG